MIKCLHPFINNCAKLDVLPDLVMIKEGIVEIFSRERFVQINAERYSNWCKPREEIFTRVHQKLCETDSVTSSCHDKEGNHTTWRFSVEGGLRK